MSPEAPIKKYEYLDACRGYAILLVMIAHSFMAFPALPWPVMRLTNLGTKGVQLFFVVSSLTLSMSWRRRSAQDGRPYLAFLVRRFFRIAPAYFLAFAFYLLVAPPGDKFQWKEALTTLTFSNGWSPATIPTVDGAWGAVPGSWSIAVEFGFYFLFPLFVTSLTTLARSLAGLAALIGLAFFADRLGTSAYLAQYGVTATDQFVFYWLPNQLPVFCLGFVTHHLVDRVGKRELDARRGTLVCALVWVAFFALAHVPFQRTPQLSPPFLPLHVAAGLLFSLFVVVLRAAPRSLFINRAAVALGKASFSAYLVHFSFVRLGEHLLDLRATGWKAIFEGSALLGFVVVTTFVAASLIYRWIEQPMIAVGHRMAGKTNGARAAVALGRP